MTNKRKPNFKWNTNPQESAEEETLRYSGPPFSQRLLKWINLFYLPYKNEQEEKDD